MTDDLEIIDVGVMEYRAAWDRQLELHAEVLSGQRPAGVLMLVEHPPVVTIGRHPNSAQHLLASPELLKSRGVDVVETDRGGDITFHGPGQIVGYPIIPLNDYSLNLHAYMRLLEETIIRTIARYGVVGERLQGATGVWVGTGDVTRASRPPSNASSPPIDAQSCCVHSPENAHLEKVCAMGVKLKRWVTLHGWALNVTTDLTYFTLINPCGLGRPVTSLEKLCGPACPSITQVKHELTREFRGLLNPIG
ncbi:MAG: lipoyl(octanoyl) transferase LipB [Phycisphaerae bacterium]